jgi:hypothetical protein
MTCATHGQWFLMGFSAGILFMLVLLLVLFWKAKKKFEKGKL